MKKLFWAVLVSLLLGSLWYVAHELGLQNDLKNFLETENLKAWIEPFGNFAPIVFMAIYYALALLFVSTTLLTVLAGVLFGKFWGTIYVIIAATAAAQTAFYISRSLGGEKLENLKDKKGIGPLIKILNDKCQKNGFQNLFILRCLFLPYIPLSYAAGMIKTATAKDFFFATLLTNMIFSPAFVYLGDSLFKGPKALILPIILIILVLLVPKILKKINPKIIKNGS